MRKIGLLLALALAIVCLAVYAETGTLNGSVKKTVVPTTRVQTKTVYVTKPVIQRVYVHDNRTYWQKHPKVKSATVGAGVGAGAGAITGLISHRGVMRGAAIGAGSGAGVGLIRSSDTLRAHPIVRDVATGTVAGLGFGAAASRHGRTIGKATGVGAAVGLGAGLLKELR